MLTNIKKKNPKVLVGIGVASQFDYVIDKCLKTVFEQDYDNFDVLLMDNSKDSTYHLTLMSKFPKAIIEHFKRPIYFRDALTQAREKIKDYAIIHGYDYLLFVDVDHILKPDTITKLISHKKDFITACIGYLHQDYSTCFIRDWSETKPSFVPGLSPCKPIYYEEMKKPPFLMEIMCCGLACALIKVPVLLGMHFYNSHKQTAFMEDLIFCSDLQKKGIKLFLDKTVNPFHMHVMMAERVHRNTKS